MKKLGEEEAERKKSGRRQASERTEENEKKGEREGREREKRKKTKEEREKEIALDGMGDGKCFSSWGNSSKRVVMASVAGNRRIKGSGSERLVPRALVAYATSFNEKRIKRKLTDR